MQKPGKKGLSLARRLYVSRALGLTLGLLLVSAAIFPLEPAPWAVSYTHLTLPTNREV